MYRLLFTILLVCSWIPSAPMAAQEDATENPNLETAVFAGGCFWCMEAAFDKVEGVVETTSGYTGGKAENPSYEEVKHGHTGHYESLKVTYDPEKVSYEKLLEAFWHNIDPFNPRGQFCDKGSQYRAAIFVSDDEQRAAASESKQAIAGRTRLKIVTEILDLGPFYPAEEYHQDYYIKNPVRYRYYSSSCGRTARLIAIWGAAAGH